MVIKEMEWRPQAAAKRAAGPVGARFIAPSSSRYVSPNGYEGVMNVAPTEAVSLEDGEGVQ